jgi:hypothetical protein
MSEWMKDKQSPSERLKDEEIFELQKENDNLKEINEKLKSTFRERMAQSQITAITKERDEYREALEWYAWNMLIEGKRAREVLAKKQG